MTTREVIDYVLNKYSKDVYDEYADVYILECISDFLDAVKIKKGYKYDSDSRYSYEEEKEEVASALEYIKTAEYPQHFDPSIFAPETDFSTKLDFLYCMALAQDSGQAPRIFPFPPKTRQHHPRTGIAKPPIPAR